MPPLPASRVFTAAEAHRLGWTPSALKHAVRTGRLVRLRRGVYTASSDPGPVEHALAAATLSPRAAVSHRSAVLLHGLPLLGAPPPLPELTVPPRGTVTDCSVHMHRAALPPERVRLVQGARCTDPARTFVDVARHLPLVAAVAVGDAVQRGGTRHEEIDAVLLECWNWPGIARAQRAADLVDGAAESALESLSRVRLARQGIPAPGLQQVILDRWHGFVARTDFYWDRAGVVGEADGLAKYVDRADLLAEKQRQDRLEALGLVVVRWTWREVDTTPHLVADRIRTGFDRGHARDRSGLPRQWVLGDPIHGPGLGKPDRRADLGSVGAA